MRPQANPDSDPICGNHFLVLSATRARIIEPMDIAQIGLTLAGIDTLCWAVCFWWMHRLSSRQQAMLEELHEVTKRIEKLSKAEHDIIQEVHPDVQQIKESVKDVKAAVANEKPSQKG